MLRFEVARVPVTSDKIHSPPKKKATPTLPGGFGGVTTFHKLPQWSIIKNTSHFRAKQRDMIRSNMFWLSDILIYVDVL